MKLTKAQEKTIDQIKTVSMIHLINRKAVTISFGESNNRIGVEIDSTGKITSAIVINK